MGDLESNQKEAIRNLFKSYQGLFPCSSQFVDISEYCSCFKYGCACGYRCDGKTGMKNHKKHMKSHWKTKYTFILFWNKCL